MRKIIKIIILSVFGIQTVIGQSNIPISEQKARVAPEWISEGIIYQIQLRSFTSEGTLKAATKKLPHIANLGTTIIYLCPVFVADNGKDTLFWSPRQKASGLNNPYNPYRIKDYYHIDPEYGTENDLKEFVSEAHKLGLKVMFDVVYRHCGPNAVFLKEHPDFVRYDEDGKIITNRYNWPVMNFDNPKLCEYLYSNMEYLIKEFDVDGFRFDSVLGIHYDIPVEFLETARKRMEAIRPDIGMLAESRGRPEDQLKAIDVCYPGWMILNYNWNKIDKIEDTWRKIKNGYPQGSRFIRFVDNHDIAHNSGTKRIEKVWGFSKVNVGLVAMLTLDGVPFLYNGQEIADTARHNIFGSGFPIDWANAETMAGKKRFTFLQKLCEIRQAEKALMYGDLKWFDNNQPKSVLSYMRTIDNDQILVVMNLSNYPLYVKFNCIEELGDRSFNPLFAEGFISGDIQNGFEMEASGFWIGKTNLRE